MPKPVKNTGLITGYLLFSLVLSGCGRPLMEDHIKDQTMEKPITRQEKKALKRCISPEEYQRYARQRSQIESKVGSDRQYEREGDMRRLKLKLKGDRQVVFEDRTGSGYKSDDPAFTQKCRDEIALFTLLDNLSDIDFYILLESHCLDCDEAYLFRAVSSFSGKSYTLNNAGIQISPDKAHILDFGYRSCARPDQKHDLAIYKVSRDHLSLAYRLEPESLEELLNVYRNEPTVCFEAEADWIKPSRIELWLKDSSNQEHRRKKVATLNLSDNQWSIEAVTP